MDIFNILLSLPQPLLRVEGRRRPDDIGSSFLSLWIATCSKKVVVRRLKHLLEKKSLKHLFKYLYKYLFYLNIYFDVLFENVGKSMRAIFTSFLPPLQLFLCASHFLSNSCRMAPGDVMT